MTYVGVRNKDPVYGQRVVTSGLERIKSVQLGSDVGARVDYPALLAERVDDSQASHQMPLRWVLPGSSTADVLAAWVRMPGVLADTENYRIGPL